MTTLAKEFTGLYPPEKTAEREPRKRVHVATNRFSLLHEIFTPALGARLPYSIKERAWHGQSHYRERAFAYMNQESMSASQEGCKVPLKVIANSASHESSIDPINLLGIDNRYTRFKRLGAGGFCNVFSCWDSIRGKTVALKRLRPDRSSRREDVHQFMNEPQLMQKFASPCVPRVYDLFPERICKPYFTMEIVAGIDLRRVLSGLRSRASAVESYFDLQTLLTLIARAADGLASAHQVGCVHRDVKPENLITDKKGGMKITDWGIALVDSDFKARRGKNASPDTSQIPQGPERRAAVNTIASTTIGTPLYMSPEQIRNPANVDARTDIFSLGAVLYDCLALTTLICGNTREQVFRYALSGDYVKPSVVTLRPEIPAAVEDVCMRATHPKVEHRFQSMEEFRVALISAAELSSVNH